MPTSRTMLVLIGLFTIAAVAAVAIPMVQHRYAKDVIAVDGELDEEEVVPEATATVGVVAATATPAPVDPVIDSTQIDADIAVMDATIDGALTSDFDTAGLSDSSLGL